MKEKLIIVSRLLQANQITVDEAVLLLEEKKDVITLPTLNPYNPSPWDTGYPPTVTYTHAGDEMLVITMPINHEPMYFANMEVNDQGILVKVR